MLHADTFPHVLFLGPATAPMPTHLRNPQGAADVHPLGPTSGGLQGSSSLGAEQALWLDSQGTCPAQPAARRYLEDPITCLEKSRRSWLRGMANLHLVST